MREILFRGKSNDVDYTHGHWVYGNLEHHFGDDYDLYMIEDLYKNSRNPESHFVVNESVGQYTGLKDCKGMKIFEGDILRIGTCSDAFCVEWDEEKAMFQVFSQYSECVEAQFDEITGRIEVVGNVHDNPELLNKLLK